MPSLETFPPGANAVVIGASGGIGAALTRALVVNPRFSNVRALSRSGKTTKAAVSGRIDITDEASVAASAEHSAAPGPIDLLIVATGILHAGEAIRPEKRLNDLDPSAVQRVFAVNALGPALVAKHFLPRLRRDRKSVFAALSARVGSIDDNRLGGWASYRASKAALNMLLKTFAIEHARLRPASAVITLHPGTVDTNLSKPFSGNVSEDKLFAPEFAAERLLDVIDRVTGADTGGFFSWDGTRIAY